MGLYIEFAKLVICIIVLVTASDKLVDSASRLAKAIGVSGTVIGLTLIAYGTSLPEFGVSSIASVEGSGNIAIGNIVGSNIYNIAFILGISAFVIPLAIKEKTLSGRDNLLMLASTIFLTAVLFFDKINRFTGLFMAVSVVLYTIYVLRNGQGAKLASRKENIQKFRESGISVLCLAVILVSSKFIVGSATNIARILSVSEWIISATIIAIGTSVPETAVSIVAAKKKEFGISIGNIVGSNIFNTLWILGFAAALRPLSISFQSIRIDLAFLIAVTAIFSFGLWKGKIGRLDGLIYLILYFAYMSYLMKPII